MVCIHMLPAGKGDFFIISYGTEEEKHYIIIDGGDLTGFKGYIDFLKKMVERQEKIDAVIFTHNDDDHLMGAMKAWNKIESMPVIQNIYMNTGRGIQKRFDINEEYLLPEKDPKKYILNQSKQHSTSHALSIIDLISSKGMADKLVSCVSTGDILYIAGAELKIISPGKEQLVRYLQHWQEDIKEKQPTIHGRKKRTEKMPLSFYAKMEHKMDQSVTNGASIAFLFEYGDCRVAFLGDAYPGVCVQGIQCFYRNPVWVDLIKVPHHGSEYNYSEELYEWLKSDRYLISTNGSGEHPNPVMLGKLFRKRPDAQISSSYDWITGYGFAKEDRQNYLEGEKPQIRVILQKEVVNRNLTITGYFS